MNVKSRDKFESFVRNRRNRRVRRRVGCYNNSVTTNIMFSHLHLHTEFSLLDGLSRIPQIMDRVSEMGQPAVAITDHGALYGALDFYKAAKARDIKPIIGVEAYVANGSRRNREGRTDRNIF